MHLPRIRHFLTYRTAPIDVYKRQMQYVTEIVANGKKDRIKEMFLMVIILAVGLALIYLFYMYAKNKFSMKVICDIRQDLFQSILNKMCIRDRFCCSEGRTFAGRF